MVVDPGAFQWSDHDWTGLPLSAAVIYELHIGTFTPDGTFAAAAARLPYLADLGITAVELMPVADFAGARNWGYDGVCLFAPARCYGTPDDLRRLIDAAHRLELAVLLDVVYNHFGPDGAYASVFSPYYFSARHASPWGPTVNLDDAHHLHVRQFLTENALHWLHEYHVDGLRLDATHALVDEGPTHFLRDLSASVRASLPERTVLLVAEDDRNLATIVRSPAEGGWGLDAVWADDFHHHVRRLAAGDRDGYFQDFSGTTEAIAATLRQGWFYCGQPSASRGEGRGTAPDGISVERMVICLQNHDQVGNRAFGDRLHHRIDLPVFRALTALLLFAPETPLLFMGQEWAATTPFLYFTDHHPALGRLVTEGRRTEFSRFAAFSDDATRARIPDPQASSTFDASRLLWDERDHGIHAGVLCLHRELLGLRRGEPALRTHDRFTVLALDDDCIGLLRGTDAQSLLLVVRLRGEGSIEAGTLTGNATRWTTVLTTEEPQFLAGPDAPARSGTDGPLPPSLVSGHGGPVVVFRRPGALIARAA
jgi:maltooligosyltrehalose trehalohydrolase